MPTVTVEQVICRFYEAAADPSIWREVLQETSDLFACEGANLLPGPNAPLSPINSPALDEGVSYGVKHGWYAHNPRVTRGVVQLARGADFVTESMIFSPQELDRIPFNAEFVNRFNLRWFVGTLLVPDSDSSLVFSLERQKRQEPFSTNELELLGKILPHLRRAGKAAVQWASARAKGITDAFEALGSGALVLDYRGRVVRMSKPAEAHLGGALRVHEGELVAVHRASNDDLQKLIRSVMGTEPGRDIRATPVAIMRRSGRPLLITGSRVGEPQAYGVQIARGLLVICDPDELSAPSELLLRKLLGLTRTEAQVASVFSLGHDLREIAERLNIKIGTVRIHMKAVMSKTGAHRQSELAILLCKLSSIR